LKQIEERDEKQPDYDPQGEIFAEIIHAQGLSMPGGASHAEGFPYPAKGWPAIIFTWLRHKMRPDLNNCKACLCQRIDRPKVKLR